MIVWRGATARTGGTVLLKIVSELIDAADIDRITVTQENILRGVDYAITPARMNPEFRSAIGNKIGLGGHDCFYSPAFNDPMFKIIFVRRNLCEAIASLKRLTNCSFSECLTSLHEFFRLHQLFNGLTAENCIFLEYAEIQDLPAVCQKIAQSIELDIEKDVIANIASCYSRDSVAMRLKNRSEQIISFLRNNAPTPDENVDRFFVPIYLDGNIEQFELSGNVLTPETLHALKSGMAVKMIGLNIPDADMSSLRCNSDNKSFRVIVDDSDADSALQFQASHVAVSPHAPWQESFSNDECKEINRIYTPMHQALGY